jgi:hypothetical protein
VIYAQQNLHPLFNSVYDRPMKNQCYQNWQLPFSKGLLLLTLLIVQQLNLFAQCSPDIVAPTILCPANLTVTVAPGICSTTVSLTAPIVNDNCPGPVTLTSTAPSNSVYPLGTTPVVFTATDAAGNPTTCQTTVTVSGGFIYTLVCNDLITIPAHPSGHAKHKGVFVRGRGMAVDLLNWLPH